MARRGGWGPFDDLDPRNPAGFLAWVIIVFVAIEIIVLALILPPPQAGSRLLSFDFLDKRSAQKTISALLIDPGSADYRNMTVIPTREGAFVCGEVNSRNRLGGYAGFKRFVVATTTGDGVIEPGDNVSAADVDDDKRECDDAYSTGMKKLYCDRFADNSEKLDAAKRFNNLWASCTAAHSG